MLVCVAKILKDFDLYVESVVRVLTTASDSPVTCGAKKRAGCVLPTSLAPKKQKEITIELILVKV